MKRDSNGQGSHLVLAYVVITVLALVIGFGVTTRRVDRNDDKLTKIMMAVTECTSADSPQACRQKQDDRAKQEGIERVAEVDCRFQRALKGLPATPPTEKCVMP